MVRPLSKVLWLLVLVAIVLGCEHLLANKFYKRDDPGLNPRKSITIEPESDAKAEGRQQKAETVAA